MLRFARNDGGASQFALASVLCCLVAPNAGAQTPIDFRGELDAFELRNAAIEGFDRLAPNANGRISYRLEGHVWRAGAENASALLVEADAATAEVRLIALRRGVDVLSLAPSALALPEALRYAALRDLIAHLRRASAGRLTHVVARGSAEQGRMLRRFARARGNADGSGGRLVDGLLLHDAGGSEAPASPVKSAAKDAPLVIASWSSGHYWRGEAASADAADKIEAPKSRSFFLAGAPASEGVRPTSAPADCRAPVNSRSIAPALRALFVSLDDWVRRGALPPASRMPSFKDRSLVAMRDFHWPGLALPAPPAGERQISAIDIDGNETAGLRLPDQAVPLGTFTGWNLRKDRPDALCDGHGAFLPFAKSKAEREQTGDPRLSLQERYGLRDYYVATVRVVADKLVRDRLLLEEDADAYVAAAKTAGF